jgi:coenzyme F420-reducing hydrogenase beta subunit
MRDNMFGFYTPDIPADAAASPKVAEICPFSNLAKNEDQISAEIFDDEDATKDPFLGTYFALHTGHSLVTAEKYGGATSGGIITWVLHELLETGSVNYVVHAKQSPETESFEFKFGITSAEHREGLLQKSKYYPTEMSQVLATVEAHDGAVAFVGLPCQIKAVRLLQEHNPFLKEKIKVCIGLICGHVKSKQYANYLAAECTGDIEPHLLSIDFRAREAKDSMASYSVKVDTRAGEYKKSMREIYASGWQYNLFRNSACDYCDDVFSETADLTVGDVWLDRYLHKEQAHSLLVVRNKKLLQMLLNGQKSGDVLLDSLTPEEAVRAQAGGLRDRRSYLAERLRANLAEGTFAVKKRVKPATKENAKLQEKVSLRTEIATASHHAWLKALERGDINVFKTEIEPLKKRLDSFNDNKGNGLRTFIKAALPSPVVTPLFKVYSKISYLRRVWFQG